MKLFFTQMDFTTDITQFSGVQKILESFGSTNVTLPNVNIRFAVTVPGIIRPYFFDSLTVTSNMYLTMLKPYTFMNYHYKSDVLGISNKVVHHRIMPLLSVPISITHFLIDGLVVQDHCAGLHNP